MSDALCGPSNALQNFQKHASVDRTLQQDRLTSRQSPSQRFRSPHYSEGILDPEFAAFESNNLVGTPLPNVQHAAHFPAPVPHMQMPMAHPAESVNWANDFQKLQISGPSHPVHQQPAPSMAPMLAASQQGWHNEFLRQQQHTPLQQPQPYVQGIQSSFASSYAMRGTQFTPTQETKPDQAPAMEAFDESAFEAAFEQAKADMASQELDAIHIEAQANVLEPKVDSKDLKQEVAVQPEPQETIRIGSDTIPQSNKHDPQSAANDADELARTAGQLLNSVSHDTSQKFRESNFLALMRRIRDREVHVEGDEFREAPQSLHPGGKYYPEGRPRQQEEEKQSWMPTSQNDYVHVTSSENNITSQGTLSHENTHTTSAMGDTISKDTINAASTGDSGMMDDETLYAAWNFGD
ncbi:hypothetical protein ARAM_004477, partial [Aspergillus rambellii]